MFFKGEILDKQKTIDTSRWNYKSWFWQYNSQIVF